MSENLTSRPEWDAMTDDEKYQSLQLTEQDNADMRGVLEEIPECTVHGFCLPHFRDWIRSHKDLPRAEYAPALDDTRLMTWREFVLLWRS